MTGATAEIVERRNAVRSDEIDPSSLDGAMRWACGHVIASHDRSQAQACLIAQRRVPRHIEEGGASAPPDATQAAASIDTDSGGLAPALPPAGLVTAEQFCTEAARLVGGPRAATHGDKSINFQNIAELWNGYWRIKCRVNDERLSTPFDAHDVGCMMELFKIARRFSGSFNADDYVDAAGYAGCTGEIAARVNQDKH